MRTSRTARQRRRRIRKTVRSVFGVISFLAFFACLGTVGAVENDATPLLEGTVRMFGFMFIWIGFAFMAGAFENNPERRNRREVHRDTVTRSGGTGR